MIDIHSHIIFAVDDGAQNEQDTLSLLRESYNQGVKKIIATPHRRKNMFETSDEVIIANFQRVKELAKEVAEDLEIYLGSEVYYTQGVLEKIEQGKYEKLANSDYLLIEFSYTISYRELIKALKNIVLLGITPVVAHIERYECLREDIDRVRELIDNGCLMQINTSSVLRRKLLGDKHKRYKKITKLYLEHDMVHFIASDMHNLDQRPTYIKESYRIIEQDYGKERADKLFKINAQKILDNEII